MQNFITQKNVPPIKSERYWHPALALVFTIIIFLVSQIIASAVLALIFMGYAMLKFWFTGETIKYATWLSDGVVPKFLYVLLIDILVVWLIFIVLRFRSLNFQDIGWRPFKKKDVKSALKGFFIYFAAYFIIAVMAQLLIPGFNVNQKQDLGFEPTNQILPLILIGFSLVILPPLVEELLMRGFLYTNLHSKLKFIPSLLITSLIFGLLHLQFNNNAPLLWVAALDTFILSTVLVYLREKSQSLWPSIILHMLKNGFAFILLFIFKVG